MQEWRRQTNGGASARVYNSQTMSKINWTRVLGCGLLAGIVWIILGSLVTALLGRDFAALPNNQLGRPTVGFIAFNVVVDLLEGTPSSGCMPPSGRSMVPAPGQQRLRPLRRG